MAPPHYRWPARPTVALDLETTGINRERDRIIQYGLYGVGPDDTPLEIASMVDAEVPTGRDPRNVPGVSLAEVRRAVPLRQGHLDTLRAACEGAVVVMHHRQHDWTLVQNEFRRNGAAPPAPYAVCCTLELARSVLKLPPPHRLGALCERYRIDLALAHNALHDARATFRLYVTLANLHWDQWLRPRPQLGLAFATRSGWFPPAPALTWPGFFSALGCSGKQHGRRGRREDKAGPAARDAPGGD